MLLVCVIIPMKNKSSGVFVETHLCILRYSRMAQRRARRTSRVYTLPQGTAPGFIQGGKPGTSEKVVMRYQVMSTQGKKKNLPKKNSSLYHGPWCIVLACSIAVESVQDNGFDDSHDIDTHVQKFFSGQPVKWLTPGSVGSAPRSSSRHCRCRMRPNCHHAKENETRRLGSSRGKQMIFTETTEAAKKYNRKTQGCVYSMQYNRES